MKNIQGKGDFGLNFITAKATEEQRRVSELNKTTIRHLTPNTGWTDSCVTVNAGSNTVIWKCFLLCKISDMIRLSL